ncbi:MAG: transglycosylase SLT domain-containing protein [Leptospirillia bacterium]
MARQTLFFCAFFCLFFIFPLSKKARADSCPLPPVAQYIVTHSRPPQPLPVSYRIARALIGASRRTHLPLYLLVAVAQQESAFNPGAVNLESGDYGLFQVHYRFWRSRLAKRSPQGLREIRRSDLLGIDVNVRAAALILVHDLRLAGGDPVGMLGRFSGRVGGAHRQYVEGVLAKGMEFLGALKRQGVLCR